MLKSVEFPSVLVETAFINNPVEARLLASAEFQRQLASQLAAGVRSYLEKSGIGYAADPRDSTAGRRAERGGARPRDDRAPGGVLPPGARRDRRRRLPLLARPRARCARPADVERAVLRAPGEVALERVAHQRAGVHLVLRPRQRVVVVAAGGHEVVDHDDVGLRVVEGRAVRERDREQALALRGARGRSGSAARSAGRCGRGPARPPAGRAPRRP